MGLEKWEDSDLRIKGSGSKKSPRSRSEEKGILEAYLEEGGGVQSGVGRWSGAGGDRGGILYDEVAVLRPHYWGLSGWADPNSKPLVSWNPFLSFILAHHSVAARFPRGAPET